MTPTQRAATERLAAALDDLHSPFDIEATVTLLRELAAEPVQEPVCWGWRVPDGRITAIFSERKDNPDVEVVALYAAPPPAAAEIERLRAALAELLACHTESAGWSVSMLTNRAEFDAMLARNQERLESAVGSARAALEKP